VEGEQVAVADQTSGRTTSKGPALPEHLIGQGETAWPRDVHGLRILTVWLGAVHDEGLKNLLMAWYYAGYYTGLMEGKHQGAEGKDEPTNK
jgi:hypothetical protein